MKFSLRRLADVFGCVTFFVSTVLGQAAWRSDDIGAVGLVGRSAETSGAFEIAGAGADIWERADAFHFMHQAWTGDGEIVARVTSQQNTHTWAKVGVMLRETTQAGSRHAFICVTPGNGVAFQYRNATGGDSASVGERAGVEALPVWVKLSRVGNVVTGFTSADGATWAQVGAVSFSALAASLEAGIAVTSHDAGALSMARLDNVALRATSGPIMPPTAGAPVVTATAAQSINSGYLFTYQISATNSPTSYSATGLPAGLTLNPSTGEIRGVCGNNAGTYHVTLRATNAAGTGTATQTLVVSGGGPIEMPWIESVTAPAAGTYRVGDPLVFLVRKRSYYGLLQVTGRPRFGFTLGGKARFADYAWGSGSPEQIFAYIYQVTAADSGAVGIQTSDTLDLNGGTITDAYPLACALNMRAVTAAEVRCEAGSAEPTATQPTWAFADIGAVGVAGANNASGNTITVQASGADVWDTADSFRFVYRQIGANAVVEACVTVGADGHDWAKSGVMIRESLAPDARNVFVYLRPQQVAVQARTATGATTSIVGGPWTQGPIWLRLVRNAARITAYWSYDGTTWSEIASFDVAMSDPVYAGFAVTSHDNLRLATAVFSDPYVE